MLLFFFRGDAKQGKCEIRCPRCSTPYQKKIFTQECHHLIWQECNAKKQNVPETMRQNYLTWISMSGSDDSRSLWTRLTDRSFICGLLFFLLVQKDKLCATNTVQQRNSPVTDNQCLHMGLHWWNRKISSLPSPRHASTTSFLVTYGKRITSPLAWWLCSCFGPCLWIRSFVYIIIYLSGFALLHCWRARKGIS